MVSPSPVWKNSFDGIVHCVLPWEELLDDIAANMQKQLLRVVEALADLPGIGPRSALRIALSFLKQDKTKVLQLCQSIESICQEMTFCSQCGNLQSKNEPLCDICNNAEASRDMSFLCVVENVADLMAIESTHAYRGVYHVLGGVLSPINGVGPEDLRIAPLLQRMTEKQSTQSG